MGGAAKNLPPIEVRFWRRVRIDMETRCYIWTGAKSKNGYGVVHVGGGKTNPIKVYAHRFAYEYFIDQIPAGLQIDHLCRNRLCVNPQHLEAVTQTVNIMRGESPIAANARKTHCPQGHPYDEANTEPYVYRKSGAIHRRCRTCIAQYALTRVRGIPAAPKRVRHVLGSAS